MWDRVNGYIGTLIDKGAILLAKSSWLDERAAAGLPIVRRQDTPAESCWNAEDAPPAPLYVLAMLCQQGLVVASLCNRSEGLARTLLFHPRTN